MEADAHLAHRLGLAPYARQAVGIESVRLDDGYGDVTREALVVRQVDALAPAFAEERPGRYSARRRRMWEEARSRHRAAACLQ
jgi:hypothetical protein